jgi:mannosyltransferase
VTPTPQRPAIRPWFTIVGLLLLVAAAIFSNTAIEAAFGRAPNSLSWGPALFRALLAFHGAALLAANLLPRGTASRLSIPIGRKTFVILASLTVLAILLRIPNLNSCLWLDEVLTMVRFAHPPFLQILTSFPDQNQHMLYSVLAHASVLLFGEQAWALRLPSVIFGVGSIWALFLVGRRLIGEKEALLACALMTVSYHHIWFSQNARGYMGLLFFTNLATWLWLEAMDRNSWGTWMGYAVAIVLGMWIHMTIVFVAGAHALIFLVVWLRSGREPARLGPAVAAYLLCATLTLQLFALSLPEFLRTGLSEFSPKSEWTNPLWVVKESIRSLQVAFAALAVVLGGGFLMAAGWFDIARRQARAAWAMVLPGVVGGGSMLLLGHNLWPRFFFFCMGFALLIAIHGAMELPAVLGRLRLLPAQWTPRVGYALAGLIILASAITVPRVYALPKQDFTGAKAYVDRELRPGDTVVVAGLAEHVYPTYYAPSWPVAGTPEELAALRSATGRTFVVYTLPIELRAVHPALWDVLSKDFETDKIFWGTLGGGEVYVIHDRKGEGRASLGSH